MKRLLTIALIGLVAATLVPSAEAKTTWDLGLYGGYARSFQEDGTDGSFGMRGSAFAMVKPTIGIGAEVARNRLGKTDTKNVFQPGTMIPTTGDISIWGWVLTGSAKWQPRAGSWRPFLIGGAGLYPMTYQISLQTGFREDVNRKEFGFNLGAGLAWVPSNSPVAIGLDVRWNSVPQGRISEEELQEVIDTGVEAEGSPLNYGTIFLGVTYNTGNLP
jgi:opacity protein-like surface antigen